MSTCLWRMAASLQCAGRYLDSDSSITSVSGIIHQLRSETRSRTIRFIVSVPPHMCIPPCLSTSLLACWLTNGFRMMDLLIPDIARKALSEQPHRGSWWCGEVNQSRGIGSERTLKCDETRKTSEREDSPRPDCLESHYQDGKKERDRHDAPSSLDYACASLPITRCHLRLVRLC